MPAFAHVPAMTPAREISTAPPPDFRHVAAWIFDLDNTLYRADSNLFAQIDARMTDYVARLLGLSPGEARRVQKNYYRDYGTTLNGLIRCHGIDPETFLDHVHDIDFSILAPDGELNAAIARLPGKRAVFTNGCGKYAARLLAHIGLDNAIDELWDIRATAYSPKPDREAYRTVLSGCAIRGERAAMFEDIARNLVPAHELGMTTVWIDNGSAWSRQGPEYPVAAAQHIDYQTADLSHFLGTIRI